MMETDPRRVVRLLLSYISAFLARAGKLINEQTYWHNGNVSLGTKEVRLRNLTFTHQHVSETVQWRTFTPHVPPAELEYKNTNIFNLNFSPMTSFENKILSRLF
jgi:hypothetical protein